ncbi:uncharacterized protein [Battus philenor]|uniref:uncharacterized protein n=1 Tax=Battus philenor TaxID=42288 RepID=UPI0035CF5D11
MDMRNVLSFKMDDNNDIQSCYNKCKKEKRYRCAFTFDQVKYLEQEFKKSRYVGVVNRKEISKVLNISERAIKIWFQNRRMREKKDFGKEFQHNQEIREKKIVDNKAMRSDITLEQTRSKTGLIDNYFNNIEQVSNSIMNNKEIGTYNRPDTTVSSPRVPNNNTPNIGGTNVTGKISIELLNKYKNNVPVESIVKTSKCNDTRQKEVEVRVCNSSVPLLTSTVTSHQPPKTRTHKPTGYVPILSQSHYQQPCLAAGSIIWKAVNSTEMATVMPVRDFAVMHQQSIPYPVTRNHNVQKNKCFCNCHNIQVSHRENCIPFVEENQMSQAQYVLVPFHKNPVPYASPIYKEC